MKKTNTEKLSKSNPKRKCRESVNITIGVTRSMRERMHHAAEYQGMSLGAFVRNLFVKYEEAKQEVLETRRIGRRQGDQ